MTNLEHYLDKIIELANEKNLRIAVRVSTGELCACNDIVCSDCRFDSEKNNGDRCRADRYKWLAEEYKDPGKYVDLGNEDIIVEKEDYQTNPEYWNCICELFSVHPDEVEAIRIGKDSKVVVWEKQVKIPAVRTEHCITCRNFYEDRSGNPVCGTTKMILSHPLTTRCVNYKYKPEGK